MIVTVGPAGTPGSGNEDTPGPNARGVVARPALLGRLGGPARVMVVSAPPGSGKTVLLRSWIGQAGLAGHAAWAQAGRDERDPRRFWLAVLGALRAAAPGAGLVQALTAAPDLDGWSVTERLLTDLAPLADRIWLVIDDVHELGPEALRQHPPLSYASGHARLARKQFRAAGEARVRQRRAEGASRPRSRARATASARRWVPSLAYRWRMWVLTVWRDTVSSAAISGAVRLVGR